MNRLLMGLLLVLTAPLCAQAEQPNMAELKADAQKVASVIRGEEATPASVGPSKPDYPIVGKDVCSMVTKSCLIAPQWLRLARVPKRTVNAVPRPQTISTAR